MYILQRAITRKIWGHNGSIISHILFSEGSIYISNGIAWHFYQGQYLNNNERGVNVTSHRQILSICDLDL